MMMDSNNRNGDDLDADFDDLNDLPDFDDSDDGIFAPEPQRKKSSSMVTLLAGVVAIAIAGGAGYMFFMKPGALPLAEIASLTPPVESASVPTAPPEPSSMPVDATQPSTPTPTDVTAEQANVAPTDPTAPITPDAPAAVDVPPETVPPVDAAQAADMSPVPAPTDTSSQVPEPSAATALETPSPQPVETAQASDAQAAPTVAEEKKEDDPSPPEVLAEANLKPVAPAETKTEEKTEEKVEEKVETPTPPDQEALKTTSQEKTLTEKTALVDEALPTPSVTQASEKEKASVQKEDKKEAPKEDKKEEEKLTYFDSPPGKALRDIPPPSINPNIAPGESIIIVQKDSSTPEGVVLEKSPETGRIESQLVAGSRALKLGRLDAALEIYNTLYRMNPRDGRILMGRSLTLQKMGEIEAAVSGYEELLRLDPNNVEATVNLMGLIRKEFPAVALQRLLDLRERYPNSAPIAAQLGVAYADAGNLDSALRYLGLAAQLQPQNPLHLFNMAVLADRAGQRQQAVSFYEKALEVDAIYGTGRAFSRDQVYDRLARLRGN